MGQEEVGRGEEVCRPAPEGGQGDQRTVALGSDPVTSFVQVRDEPMNEQFERMKEEQREEMVKYKRPLEEEANKGSGSQEDQLAPV